MTDGTGLRASTPFGAFLREVGAEHAATRSRVSSDPIPREKWPQLRRAVTPMPGESLRSVVYRSCALNHLPNSWGLLQRMGVLNRNRVTVAEHPDVATDELAHSMRVSHLAVTSRRHPTTRPGYISFFGLELDAKALTTRIRRCSPKAYATDMQRAQSNPEGFEAGLVAPYHRSIWEIREIPFCLDHWDMLQDSCPCEDGGVVQRWTRTASNIHECDKCGEPLFRTLEVHPVPEDLRSDLSILRALVHVDPTVRSDAKTKLPAEIRHVDRSRIYDLLMRVARALDPDARLNDVADPHRRLHGLWMACHAMAGWSGDILDLPWHQSVTMPTIRDIRRDWVELAIPAADRPRHPVSEKPRPATRQKIEEESGPRLIGIRPATELARLSDTVLRRLFDAGILPQHYRVHGQRKLPAFVEADMERFGEDWRRRVEPDGLASEFGIPLHGVEQIAAMKVIPADAAALPGTGPHFRPEAVDAFLDAIEDRAVDLHSNDEPITLTDAMRGISGRAKPWGPVFAKLLDGTIPFGIQAAERISRSIVVSPSQVRAIIASTFDRADHPEFEFAQRMSQGDALDMFNIAENARRVLESLPSQGINPITYLVEDVEDLARGFVALPDLARALGMNAPKAYEHLSRLGYREDRPGIWKRILLVELTGSS